MRKKAIGSGAPGKQIYPPPKDFKKRARIKSLKAYREIYRRSVDDPEGFWSEQAQELSWFKKWTKVLDYDFYEAKIRWFEGGKINVSFNCLDRHLDSWRRNKAALICVGEKI